MDEEDSQDQNKINESYVDEEKDSIESLELEFGGSYVILKNCKIDIKIRTDNENADRLIDLEGKELDTIADIFLPWIGTELFEVQEMNLQNN